MKWYSHEKNDYFWKLGIIIIFFRRQHKLINNDPDEKISSKYVNAFLSKNLIFHFLVLFGLGNFFA